MGLTPYCFEAWRSIVGLVRGMADGLSDEELDWRPDERSMSMRETAHHVVEANVVAAGIVIAALGSPGFVFDWSWMIPCGEWMERLRYAHKPLAPALRLLDALNSYVAAQVEPLPDGLERRVRPLDQPGAELRTVTVAEVLHQEASHAREHVEDLLALRVGRAP